MIDIEQYMNDGANYQAQCMLAMIRRCREQILDGTYDDNYHKYRGTLEVGRYENCREQGYVFTITYKNEERHYAVYEHRNSDDLIVLIANGASINTPGVDFMWKDHGENSSKYDYDKAFHCEDFIGCTAYIVADMKKFIEEINEKKS